MSSSQIFWASSADLPFGPRPPVIAMLKPILIGSPDWAVAPVTSAVEAVATTAAHANSRLRIIQVLPCDLLFGRILRSFAAVAPVAYGRMFNASRLSIFAFR